MLEKTLVAVLPFIVVLTIGAMFVGRYLARVFQGQHTFLTPLVGGIERGLLHIFGVRQDEEQTWKQYAVSLLLFNALGLCFLFILQLVQQWLPGNPQHLGAVRLDTAFNAAVSFMTNTNWQGYGGETTMSYLTQMLGMTVQNFVSAATGMAIVIAMIRGLVRHTAKTIGNFWVDLTRSVLYILLPLAFVLALILVSQGVVQTFSQYKSVPLLQATSYQQAQTDAGGNPVLDASGNPVMVTVQQTQQVLAVGPAASQIAIKQLGTNGGGFFNVNSAHPFENPTPLSNFFEVLAILLISSGLCYTFGMMVGDTRQGWAVLAAMLVIFIPLLGFCYWSEQS